MAAVVRSFACGLPMSVALAVAQAQSVAAPPGIGEALKQLAPPAASAPAAPARPPILDTAQPTSGEEGQDTIWVQAFNIEGATGIVESALQAALAPYLRRALKWGDVEAAATAVTNVLRAQGYLLARTLIPQQRVVDGRLTLRVVIGRYGSVKLINHSLVNDEVLRGQLSPLVAGQPVQSPALDRVMLLTSDLAGAQMPKVTVAPGVVPETSDLTFDVGPALRYAGSLMGDNQGSRYTGSNRLTAALDIYSPTGRGDQLSLGWLQAQGGGLQSGRLGYVTPILHDGLRADGAVAHVRYRLGGAFESLDASGLADTAAVGLSYPLARTRHGNLLVSGSISQRHMRDDVGVSGTSNARDVQAWSVKLQPDFWCCGATPSVYFSGAVGMTAGRLAIRDEAARAINREGPDTAGPYAKANLDALVWAMLAPRWRVSLSFTAQRAWRRNLDGSEQMSLSGPRGVKAYQDVVLGDHGYLVALEGQRDLPTWWGLSHALNLFAHSGRLYLYDPSYTVDQRVVQSDVGLGYGVTHRSLMATVQLAWRVGAAPWTLPEAAARRVLIQAGCSF